ncbi:MAG: SpoIVB peptidase [Clostridia bacterium]|nr:SpoIVB peptidase [Clostridia bacterium]
MPGKKSFYVFIFCALSATLVSLCEAETQSCAAVQASCEMPQNVIPLGVASGIRLYCGGCAVVGINPVETDEGKAAPAKDAGIRVGDVITSLDGEKTGCIADVVAFMENHSGGDIEIGFERCGEEKETVIRPARAAGCGAYKLGLVIRDSEAGIGTLTYLDPTTGEFGGLGHGIQDPDTGRLFSMKSGDASNVIITGIIKGYKDKPGELLGIFVEGDEKTGEVLFNTDSGIYGTAARGSGLFELEAAETASDGEIICGKAEILSDILSDNVERFEIVIERVYNSKTNVSKNMLIRVTDERLLSATGGIIQGMSGSPIIQNGKIIGAVTHVMVHDPARGYAISIENMIKNAKHVEYGAFAA